MKNVEDYMSVKIQMSRESIFAKKKNPREMTPTPYGTNDGLQNNGIRTKRFNVANCPSLHCSFHKKKIKVKYKITNSAHRNPPSYIIIRGVQVEHLELCRVMSSFERHLLCTKYLFSSSLFLWLYHSRRLT